MSAIETLRTLASGAGVSTGVLGACRLESGNTDAFGVEAVGDAFRRDPMGDAAEAPVVAAPGHIAIFGAREAVVADLYDDRIGRLWRIGQADPGAPEPAVGVAFDTDLHQTRADVFVEAADHPALDPAALDRVVALGRAIVADGSPDFAAYRTRAFALRAFGDGQAGCVLFAIQAIGANPRRDPSLTFAAAQWRGEDDRIVRDPLVPRAAHVRIVA